MSFNLVNVASRQFWIACASCTVFPLASTPGILSLMQSYWFICSLPNWHWFYKGSPFFYIVMSPVGTSFPTEASTCNFLTSSRFPGPSQATFIYQSLQHLYSMPKLPTIFQARLLRLFVVLELRWYIRKTEQKPGAPQIPSWTMVIVILPSSCFDQRPRMMAYQIFIPETHHCFLLSLQSFLLYALFSITFRFSLFFLPNGKSPSTVGFFFFFGCCNMTCAEFLEIWVHMSSWDLTFDI